MEVKGKKSKYSQIDNKQKEENLENIPVPIEEEEQGENNENEENKKKELNIETNLQFMLKFPNSIDNSDDLNPENIETLESFINMQKKEIADELFYSMKKICEFNVPDLKRIVFAYSVFKCEKIASEVIFDLFRSKLKDMTNSEKFVFSEEYRAKLKTQKKILFEMINSCLNEKLENLAIEITTSSSFVSIDGVILKKAIDFDYFKFLRVLLKKTKEYFKNQVEKNISEKSTRYSQAQAFKNIFVNSLSLKHKFTDNEIDFWTEHDIANDYIHKCLLKNQEIAAIKILVFYFMKFSRNYVKYSILDYAILNKSFYFVKKYYDVYPRTRYKIKDFECITLIVDLLDDKDNFMHGIFLLSKVNILSLNEVYIRLIIDKYQNFIKYKLMLITYCLNPILVCVMIIKNLRTLENLYANLRIKIKTICDEYLNLAIEIVTKINDDTILKTIFLKIFYPSSLSLLSILYSEKQYFLPVLQNDILFNIVNDLWHSECYWTFNFMNSSSAAKNSITYYGSRDLHINPLEERFYMNKMIEKDAYEVDTDDEDAETKDDIDNTPMHKLLFHKNIKGEFVTTMPKEIEFKNPFFFYQKIKFGRDIRYTNHIFSYYFFEKSAAFKVAFEILMYILFSVVMLFNVFSIFRIRREFDDTPRDILYFSDGLIDFYSGLTTSSQFQTIIANYSMTNGYSGQQAFIHLGQLYSQGYHTMCWAAFPWYINQCTTYFDDATEIIDIRKNFWILQLFYYLVFLQSFCEVIFIMKVQKKLIISTKNWIDTFLCILNFYIHAYYFSNLHNTFYALKNDELDHYKTLEEMIAVFIFLIWIKFITYLKLIKQFGTIIKVIEVMMTNLLNFFVLFGIIILAFASICFNLFDQYNPALYGTFWVTLRSLILLIFGQIDFSGFTGNNLLAAIILNLYMIITFVLLLNLLIAILSNTFNSYNQKSNLQNASVLYSDYLAKKADKFYSILITLAPPFNIIMLLAAPAILLKKSSKLNKLFVNIGFIMYSMVFLTLFIAVNICIAIPACYIRLSITIPLNLVVTQRQKKGILIWLIWIFCSPFYMVYIFFKSDLMLFIRSMFYTCSMKDKLDEITKEEIMLVYKTAEENLKEGKEYINYQELVDSIKDGIEEINRNFRSQPQQILQSKNNLNIIENIKKKTAKIIGLTDYAAENKENAKDLTEKIENKINVFVEIDKMEVFSFLRQFIGINGMINLEKLIFLINQIKFCKKFHLITLSKTKRNKLIKVIQVNQMLAVEKSVINMMAEQVRNSKIFDKVLKKFIC